MVTHTGAIRAEQELKVGPKPEEMSGIPETQRCSLPRAGLRDRHTWVPPGSLALPVACGMTPRFPLLLPVNAIINL